MAQSRQAIQSRIRSVESTRKITRVMQLIASTELTKQRRRMEENREYVNGLEDLLAFAVRSSADDSIYLRENKEKPNFVIVFTSDMGLCGAYNANIFRMLDTHSKDDIVMIGTNGCTWAKANHKVLHKGIENINLDNAYEIISKLLNDALKRFENGEIGKIQVLYTHFKNVLTYIPTLETVLPVQKQEIKEEVQEGAKQLTDYEPDQDEMLAQIIPMAVKSAVYARFLESKTSEQASRRMAMEAATDNADELHDELMLAYNQARQAAITNEIIDIVGGANALS